MRRRRLLLLLVVGGMIVKKVCVGGMETVWLMQAMVLHATSPFIIITRCRSDGDGMATSAGVANAGRGRRAASNVVESPAFAH